MSAKSQAPAPPAAVPAPYDAIIALGSNIGDKSANIAAAIAAFTGDDAVRLIARSADYRTAPWGNTDQDWFVNAAMTVATALTPRELLARCQSVERQLGRARTVHWGPRVIDLDIIVYRDCVMNDPDLVLPHPHMTARAFVLRPVMDVAPGLSVKGHPVGTWLARIPHDDVVALPPT